jgi:apolipoprotein D and lipocalin family protein
MRSATLALAVALALAGCQHAEPLRTVDDFDAQRYLGTWQEIVAIPAWFQQDCVSDTTASYAPAPEPGEIVVTNSCRTADGALAMAVGRARFTAPANEGRLEVTFVELGGHWLWPIAGAYEVLALDPGYRWSLVGHPSRDYAWILAREARLDPATLVMLRHLLAAARYDPCRLIVTAQGDPRRGQSLCAVP